jgi:hypothetical protein
MALNTTPATVTTGQVATAALWNLEVRDALTGIQAAWTSYTPTLTGITLGNGVLVCGFTRYGKTVKVRGNFTAGTTTTYSATTFAFSLPVVPSTTYTTSGGAAAGAAYIGPTAATRCAGTAYITTAGVLSFLCSTPANSVVTNLVPGTWAAASSSTLTFQIEYEAA